MKQEKHGRYILHLLHANVINRGGPMKLSGGTVSGETQSIEVIDELSALTDIQASLSLPDKVSTAKTVPDGREIKVHTKDGRLTFTLDKLQCHQMIELKQA